MMTPPPYLPPEMRRRILTVLRKDVCKDVRKDEGTRSWQAILETCKEFREFASEKIRRLVLPRGRFRFPFRLSFPRYAALRKLDLTMSGSLSEAMESLAASDGIDSTLLSVQEVTLEVPLIAESVSTRAFEDLRRMCPRCVHIVLASSSEDCKVFEDVYWDELEEEVVFASASRRQYNAAAAKSAWVDHHGALIETLWHITTNFRDIETLEVRGWFNFGPRDALQPDWSEVIPGELRTLVAPNTKPSTRLLQHLASGMPNLSSLELGCVRLDPDWVGEVRSAGCAWKTVTVNNFGVPPELIAAFSEWPEGVVFEEHGVDSLADAYGLCFKVGDSAEQLQVVRKVAERYPKWRWPVHSVSFTFTDLYRREDPAVLAAIRCMSAASGTFSDVTVDVFHTATVTPGLIDAALLVSGKMALWRFGEEDGSELDAAVRERIDANEIYVCGWRAGAPAGPTPKAKA